MVSLQFQFTPRIIRNDLQMMGTASGAPFVVPLTHDVNTNQTALFDRLNKQPLFGNELRYQNIIKILSNSRETMSKRTCYRQARSVEYNNDLSLV